MDVIEIDGASNNSVDQIRDLRDDCQYAPTQRSFKITLSTRCTCHYGGVQCAIEDT